MSNRRKSVEERTGQKGYGRKSRRGRAMFRFDFLKGGKQGPTGSRDRSLNGKDRIRARRAANREQ